MESCVDHLQRYFDLEAPFPMSRTLMQEQYFFPSARCSQIRTPMTHWSPRSRMSTRRIVLDTRQRRVNGRGSTPSNVESRLRLFHPSPSAESIRPLLLPVYRPPRCPYLALRELREQTNAKRGLAALSRDNEVFSNVTVRRERCQATIALLYLPVSPAVSL